MSEQAKTNHRHYYAFRHTYGQHTVDSDGDPIGTIYAFDSRKERDQYVEDAQAEEPYVTNAGYVEEISTSDPYVRKMLHMQRRWGIPTINHG
jgi:hypothetical protein